jgi:hypothetical protein
MLKLDDLQIIGAFDVIQRWTEKLPAFNIINVKEL